MPSTKVASAGLAAGAGDLVWSVQSTNFTAVANNGYYVNTTSAAITITLPATPSVGNSIGIVDYAGTFDTNALTINPNGNKIESGTDNLALTGDREGVTLNYVDATQGWLCNSGINEGTDALSPPPYSIDFLVVAGGGGGGGGSGSTYDFPSGAGGAGGFRTSTQSVSPGTVITVTVGDGGAGRPNETSTRGANGSDSSISGSGLTTITSAGGGGGGAARDPYSSAINDGGSGGSGGAGGLSNGTAGTGGTGGGGNGGAVNGNGSDGTANLGGGGGGRGDGNTNAGSGGKGVVILSVPTASYSGTSTGSPTTTTFGSNTILQFNGSGSYTT